MSALVWESRRDFVALAREEDLIAGTLRRAAQEHVAPQQLSTTIVIMSDYLMIGGHWRLGMILLPLDLGAQREVGNRVGEGITLNNLGYLARGLGQPEEARRFYEQALVFLRAVGNRAVEGTVLGNLGDLAESQGRLDEAEDYYRQALAAEESIGAAEDVEDDRKALVRIQATRENR